MAHPDNRFYGHDVVLARAAGLVDGPAPPIFGHVQHGWQLGTGLSDAPRLVSWLPKLVWSEANLRLCAALGIRGVRAIGAPFLYLEPEVEPEPSAEGASSTIAYPLHGWEREAVIGPHDAMAESLRERESGPVTVCLYWVEHDRAEVRRAYEARGLRVITHGRREDPTFLVRQAAELRRHGRVVSNRASTALFYGMWSGLEGEVYGPRFLVRSTEEADRRDAVYARRWPELHRGPVQGDDAHELAAAELGAAHVLAAEELREALGWGRGGAGRVAPPRRAALGFASAGALAEHKVRAALARRPGAAGGARRMDVLDAIEADPMLGTAVSR